MPSNRRLKAFLLLVGAAILLTFYVKASAGQTRSSQFYTKTSDALAAARAQKDAKARGSGSAVGEDSGVAHRLKEAEKAAKKEADRKGDAFHGEDTKQKVMNFKEKWDLERSAKTRKGSSETNARLGVGEKGVAGRKVFKAEEQATLHSKELEKDASTPKKSQKEIDDEGKAHSELNDILKRSPIIIFSKTYCPHSKRAKQILLEKYKITPSPYVVELDTHPLGLALQNYLGELTGRKTVPNIMINAKSIGGGDDVQSLDEDGKLEETIKGMGGKRMEIAKVAFEGIEKHD